MIEGKLQPYYDFFAQPLSLSARLILFLSIISVFFVFGHPLWTISFRSNQYPDPLRMAIHIDHLAGQKTEMRDDLREINSLNHYIGMRPLTERDFPEFLWMPFVIGMIVLLILRAVVFGRLRDLVDIAVLYGYFGLFSAWDFYHRMWSYGHELSPEAAIKVDPFMPPMFGEHKIANFWISSFPGGASYALGAFGILILIALGVAVWRGWRTYRSQIRVPDGEQGAS
jgi:copper chaperone NosL